MPTCIRLGLATLVLAIGLSVPTNLQAAPQPETLLEDFIHYALTAQVDMAQANGTALIDSGITDENLAVLVDDDPALRQRLVLALRWAREVPELEAVASQIETRVEKGRHDLARDETRITEAIEMLDGTRRARTLAYGRLVEAGEHAVPPMLRSLEAPETSESVRLSIQQILPSLGREAVGPLIVALPNLSESQQHIVIASLGEIGYPHAVPALVALHRHPDTSASLGHVAARNIGRLGWDRPEDIDEARLHSLLAGQYMQELEHLRSRPMMHREAGGEVVSLQNIWAWDPYGGLVSEPVPTDLYWPVMAIRHAATARELDETNDDALAAFVAGNLRLENRLGSRDIDLPLPDPDRSPAFHATVHGPSVAQAVLLMALDQDDTDLARDALAALGRTGGAGNLVTGAAREPITEALMHPDRRVQYDAALVSARAMPSSAFPGSNRVVPLLGSAALGGAGQRAAVVSADEAARRDASERLERAGMNVISSGGDFEGTLASAGGLDLIYLHITPPESNNIEQAVPVLASLGTPTIVVLPEADLARSRSTLEQIDGIGLLRAGASEEAMGNVLSGLDVSGGIDDTDRAIYAADALAALRDLALARPGGLDPREAMGQLEHALRTTDGGEQLLVAEVLSLLDDPTAQQSVLDAALNARDENQQIALIDLAGASVRRFGDDTTPRQAADLRKFIAGSRGAVADAAARLYGAMNRGDSTVPSTAARP